MLSGRASVLDLGCGSGIPLARDLAAAGLMVTGVDSSSALIDLFRENVPEGRGRVADMRTLALEERFAGIIAWDSFFHLTPDDQRATFDVFQRHARAGTALLFTTGPAAGESLGSLEGEPLYHASLDPDEYTTLLDRHGFDVTDHIEADPDCAGHTVWLARHR
ncbi:MAG: methyltransferase [Microbacterium sp.]|nr:methyltransferase [Microbacterium sp.]